MEMFILLLLAPVVILFVCNGGSFDIPRSPKVGPERRE